MDKKVLIEKYVQGILSEEERLEFDTLLGVDKGFSEEVAFHTNLKRVTEVEDEENFRGMLDEFEEEIRNVEGNEITRAKEKKGLFDRRWLVAASVILLLGLGVFYNLNQPVSSTDLYMNYFEPYPNVVQPVVRGDETSAVSEAFEAYENGRFEEALTRFTDLQETKGDSYYLFYRANALLNLERPNEAIVLLREFATTDDKLADRSGWYLAMAYLQLDDKEQAKIELEKVVESNAYNASKAKELLAELK